MVLPDAFAHGLHLILPDIVLALPFPRCDRHDGDGAVALALMAGALGAGTDGVAGQKGPPDQPLQGGHFLHTLPALPPQHGGTLVGVHGASISYL